MTQINENWDACPAGEIGRMVDQRRAGRRRKTIGQVASVVAVVMLVATCLAVASPWIFSTGAGAGPGGIACKQVRELLPAYAQRSLEPAVMQQVTTHLERCLHCRQVHEKIDGASPAAEFEVSSGTSRVALLAPRR